MIEENASRASTKLDEDDVSFIICIFGWVIFLVGGFFREFLIQG